MVYELYALTPEEIAVVEESTCAKHLNTLQVRVQVVVGFDVEVLLFWLTCNPADRDFGCQGTVPDDT